MAEVHQVINDVAVIRFHRDGVASPDVVAGIGIEVAEFRNQALIGFGIAHPDPDQRVFFPQRIGFDAAAFRDPATAVGVFDALAAGVKFESVVAALDAAVGQELAQAKRCQPVGTHVVHRYCFARGVPEKDQRLIEQRAGSDLAGFERFGPHGGVPAVFQVCDFLDSCCQVIAA